jgi:hypothetical protein
LRPRWGRAGGASKRDDEAKASHMNNLIVIRRNSIELPASGSYNRLRLS